MILMNVIVKSCITNGLRTPVNLSLTKKYESFSILVSDILWKLPPTLLTGMSKCQLPQLLFPVDFRAFSACFAIQNL